MAQACIGTSGWNYKGWKEGFYQGVPQTRWLLYCVERFTGIEINGTFYRLQSPETFRKWHDIAPPGFRFTMKGHRFVTHNKKLKDSADSVALERERAQPMGEKLAAVVWQLPRSLKKSMERLEEFTGNLDAWPGVRHTIEFRDSSWFDDEVAECLARHRVAVCQSDAADWPLWGAVTTDMVYIRLHGHTRTYASRYSDSQLDAWGEKTRKWLREGRDVHVYFDNDSEGHAPWDALRLLGRVSES
ncbi:DUF72 domain-containing protein [Thiohalomonas denitrificans]|uniref:DUF72 domain-containing protein n=1 Tax=Thiohalomonas denitrificans TaxID=415747 RepID=UPI0026F1ADF1|nr:DUF72 domain-containing protein [Thiohalomonas denitrificans]